MKWFSGTIAGFFLGLIVLIVYIAFRAGFHLPVEVELAKEKTLGPFTILYKEVVGPYHEVASHIIELEEFSKKHHIICPRTFGHYLDDPSGVDHDRLRSHVGCLFETPLDLTELSKDPIFTDKAYKIGEISFPSYISGSFDGSPAMGAIKVYPKIFKLAKNERLALNNQALEIYEVKSSSKVRTQVFFEIKD